MNRRGNEVSLLVPRFLKTVVATAIGLFFATTFVQATP